MEQPPEPAVTFDLISMLDVYEHVPFEARTSFNNAIAQSLSSQGVLAITTPTRLHQKFLAKNHPNELQVIDETIELPELLDLAQVVGGKISQYGFQSIYRSNDYAYTVIERTPHYRRFDESLSIKERLVRKWNQWTWFEYRARRRREQLVYRTLGNVGLRREITKES